MFIIHDYILLRKRKQNSQSLHDGATMANTVEAKHKTVLSTDRSLLHKKLDYRNLAHDIFEFDPHEKSDRSKLD